MAFLEVGSLSAGYQESFVLHDVSFALESGGFLSVLGRNGSGKSTLVKALLRLLKKCAGEVRVGGQSLSALSRHEVALTMAYVPQISDLPFEYSVFETISMGRYVHQGRWGRLSADDRQKVEESMSLTDVAHLKDSRTAHISGGEQQRVFIARALAQDAPLLLLDEPSAHLDISFQVEIYSLLKKLQREKGKTIVLTEHNINLAVPYSDTLLFLKEGRALAMGPPESLVTRDLIQAVFDAEVDVRENPRSGLPEISLIPRLGGNG